MIRTLLLVALVAGALALAAAAAAHPPIRGIGYVSLAFTNGVNVVNYNGVACTLRNAASFQYGGVRSFYFVTRGAPVGGVKKFINWVTHNKKANNIIGTDWIPLH